MRRITTILILTTMLAALAASGWAEEPAMKDFVRAKQLTMPAVEQELGRDVLGRTWDFSQPDRGNFTYFSQEVQDLQVTPDKTLRFRMDAGKVTLGWGNYDGKQPLAKRINLWLGEGPDYIYTYAELRVKQSADKSTWTLRTWHDGKADPKSSEAALEGTEWQVLKFRYYSDMVPDGFGLEIAGPKGSIIEVASLRFTRDVYEGYFRKEFQIPAGQIWRAMAEVGNSGYLYVNGKEVPMENSIFQRPWLAIRTTAVDLKPYLKPGKNCIGLYGKQIGPDVPYIYLQGQVIMSSGEIIRLDTDDTWRFSARGGKGWNGPSFDDQDWESAQTKAPRYNHYAIEFVWPGIYLPVYDGRLVLENPYQAKLFYDNAQPVVVQVRVPEGVADQKPTLSWILNRAEEEGEKEVAQGEVSRFRRSKDSLIYEIDCGKLARGVYTIKVALRSGEEVIEERPREPLMVLGKIPMKEVEGKTYEEGMKLVLEDTIDFTNPKDPHAWVETPVGPNLPRIVRQEGMVYRETAPSMSAMFSYRFQFQHPGSFYMMVLEYPNDAERWIGVSCSTTLKNIWTNSKAGPSVWTGDKYPLTNTLQELRWIFRSGPGPHTIDIVSIQRGSRAAAARLHIYRIEELPALKVNPSGSGRRWLGLYTESTTVGCDFEKTFGRTRQPLRTLRALGRLPVPRQSHVYQPLPELIQYLRDVWDACEHYTRYLRFTGQNLYVMGCFQYDDVNQPFISPAFYLTSRVPCEIRETAIRVFGHNGIDVIGSVEYAGHTCLRKEYPLNDGQVAMGADTALTVSKEGKQPSTRPAYSTGWNFLHPRIEGLMLLVAEELAEKFKEHPNFKGINWTPYFTGEWIPTYGGREWVSPLFCSYDDVTIKCFERDTKIRVPVDPKDPQRFQKRYTFLTSEAMREKWIEWRCQKVREFFLKVRDRVQAKRKDLDVFLSLYLNVGHVEDWFKSGKSVRQFMREWGFDPVIYRNDQGLWFTRWMQGNLRYSPCVRNPKYISWEQKVGPEFIDLYARKSNRSVLIQHSWNEINYRAPGAIMGKSWWEFTEESDWPLPGNRGRFNVQPNAENAREPFTQALIGSDPQVVIFGLMHVNLMVGHEQQLREFARVLRALPPEKFSPVLKTGLDTNLALRESRKGGKYYFYVANPGYWPIRGSVTLSGARRVIDLTTNLPIETKREGARTVVLVDLKPYGVAAYGVDEARAQVVSWKTEAVSEKDLAHMRKIVERTEELLRDPKAVAVLLPDELPFVQKIVAQAKADLAAGQYARAWLTLTNGRFWTLLHEQMEKAVQYAVRVPVEAKPVDVEEPRILKITWAKVAPKIDGKLSDMVWKQAKPATGFVTNDKRPAMVASAVRMAYDANNLYVAFECADPDPSSLARSAKQEMEIWALGDDAVAMFLQPDPRKPVYYQMAVTAGAVKFDQKVAGKDRDYDFAPPWEVATSVIKNGWMAEAMIPHSSLAATAGAGKVWRGNFFRQFRHGLLPSSFWSWVLHGAHDMARFGELRFLPPG